jgi:hypothetical protein
VANTLGAFRNEAVGFIDWLDRLRGSTTDSCGERKQQEPSKTDRGMHEINRAKIWLT